MLGRGMWRRGGLRGDKAWREKFHSKVGWGRNEMIWCEGRVNWCLWGFWISVVLSFIGVLVGVLSFFGGCNRSGHGWRGSVWDKVYY